MGKFRFVYVLLLLLPALGCSPSADTDSADGEVGPRIDSLFAEFTVPGSPGATAMVIRDGEVVHAGAYGLAELASGQALSRGTPVRLGSVSKQFTSMGIMILEERGELTFDQLITEWVPELRRFPGVRVSHLLQHTSGLPDYYELPDEAFHEVAEKDGDPLLTNADAVTIYESWGDPVFTPGEKYEYSNPGYEILGLIIERISGQTFGTFLAENIFDPLGMASAVVRDRPDVVIPGRAVGYSPDEDSGEWIENDHHFGNWLVGAGGVYASLDDLFLWDQALYTEDLVQKETLGEAFAPTILNDGSVSDYGFGWNVGDRLGRRAVHHGGGWVGFRTSIIRFVDEGMTVIVLSNASAGAGELADQVALAFLDLE